MQQLTLATMGKARAAYPPVFRRQMVELVRAGRLPEELAREFEPSCVRQVQQIGQGSGTG
jgi:hypothetical protein